MAEEEEVAEMLDIEIWKPKEGKIDCRWAASWEDFANHAIKFQKESIHTLSLYICKIVSFPPGSFSAFPNLTSLDIIYCETTKLSKEAFGNLPKLKELCVNDKISEIPVGFFNNLTSLEIVNLCINKIENIASGTFNTLSSLKKLNLSENVINSVSSDAFKGVVALENLDLSKNKIEQLEETTFKGLSNLKELLLSSNQIKSLSSEVFRGLTALEKLDLSENKLEKCEETIFRDLKNLKELHLNDNPLESVSLEELDSLLKLDLNNNKLPDTNCITSAKLKKLQKLFLGRNPISCLPNDFSDNLGELELLYFSGNPIKEAQPRAFQGLLKIKNIYLNYCTFTNVQPELLKNVPFNLKLEISLEGNPLKVLLKDTFNDFCKLTVLYMENAKIERIEAGAFKGLSSVQELHLQNNLLRKLEFGMFEGLTSLRKLDLESNKIEKLEDGCFKDLKYLTWLNLDGNQLPDLQGKTFKDLVGLMCLSMKYNNMKNIECTDGLKSLIFLDLSHNSFESDLENSFDGCVELAFLYLVACGLTSIGTLSSGILNKLVVLDISGNDIKELRLEFFKHVSPSCILKANDNKIPTTQFLNVLNEYPDITFDEFEAW